MDMKRQTNKFESLVMNSIQDLRGDTWQGIRKTWYDISYTMS